MANTAPSPPAIISGSKGAPGTCAPGGPNSFIFMQFMQFSAKILKNYSTFGSWRTPLGKILDPPLVMAKSFSMTWDFLGKFSKIVYCHHPTPTLNTLLEEFLIHPCFPSFFSVSGSSTEIPLYWWIQGGGLCPISFIFMQRKFQKLPKVSFWPKLRSWCPPDPPSLGNPGSATALKHQKDLSRQWHASRSVWLDFGGKDLAWCGRKYWWCHWIPRYVRRYNRVSVEFKYVRASTFNKNQQRLLF